MKDGLRKSRKARKDRERKSGGPGGRPVKRYVHEHLLGFLEDDDLFEKTSSNWSASSTLSFSVSVSSTYIRETKLLLFKFLICSST